MNIISSVNKLVRVLGENDILFICILTRSKERHDACGIPAAIFPNLDKESCCHPRKFLFSIKDFVKLTSCRGSLRSNIFTKRP